MSRETKPSSMFQMVGVPGSSGITSLVVSAKVIIPNRESMVGKLLEVIPFCKLDINREKSSSDTQKQKCQINLKII